MIRTWTAIRQALRLRSRINHFPWVAELEMLKPCMHEKYGPFHESDVDGSWIRAYEKEYFRISLFFFLVRRIFRIFEVRK